MKKRNKVEPAYMGPGPEETLKYRTHEAMSRHGTEIRRMYGSRYTSIYYQWQGKDVVTYQESINRGRVVSAQYTLYT